MFFHCTSLCGHRIGHGTDHRGLARFHDQQVMQHMIRVFKGKLVGMSGANPELLGIESHL